jgi:hypothetical protein
LRLPNKSLEARVENKMPIQKRCAQLSRQLSSTYGADAIPDVRTEVTPMTRGRLITAFVIALGVLVSGCASSGSGKTKSNAEGYGPLTFNRADADFYFSQAGQFARTELSKDGAIEVHLKNAPFQLGYTGRQLNLAMAQTPITEISTDPKGYKASRLSGPMAGGRLPNSDELLVYSGREWSDGNTEFSDSTSMRASPMKGFQHAYQINKLAFVADEHMKLENFKGTLHGYIVVYKQHKRKNRDIMPIRLIFDGHRAAH